MTIHDDAAAAFRQVYDTALAAADQRAAAAEADAAAVRAQLQTTLAELDTLTGRYQVDVAALQARIAQLEQQAPVPAVAGAQATDYPVPAGAVVVSTLKDFLSALTTTAAGGVIVVRGGTYAVAQLVLRKTITIQRYGTEQVIFDGGRTATSSLTLKAGGIQIAGITFTGYKTPTTADYLGSFMVPDGADGATITACTWADNAGNAVTIFGCKSVTVQYCTIVRSGRNSIGSNNTQGLTIRGLKLRDANLDGVPMAPSTSNMKHTRAAGLIIAGCDIVGPSTASGIWLDISCVDFAIVGNVIAGTGVDGIQVELSGFGIIAGNRVGDGPKYGIRVLNSHDIRGWNNDVGLCTLRQLEVFQDARRAATSEDPARNSINGRLTWLCANVEFVNTKLAPGGTQLEAFDYANPGVVPATAMLSLVAGNQFGDAGKIAWGQPGGKRDTLTVAQMEAKYPTIAHDNGTPQPIPADIAELLDVPAGTAVVGAPRPAPVTT